MDKAPSVWRAFAEYAQERAPDERLLRAIKLVTEKETALDMGAGALNETKVLLNEGFRTVIALDAEPGIAERAKGIEGNERLEVVVSRFEAYEFPINTFDLINARYSLPFIPPDVFEEVFQRMKGSLKPGGIFLGQLFGNSDCRNAVERITTHSRTEVEQLLADMEVLELQENEYDGPTYRDGIQHWHVFNVLARRR